MGNPGLLYASSKITKPDVLTEKNYLQWYDQKHIPGVLATKIPLTAYRYSSVPMPSAPDAPPKDPKDEQPYLVIYPVADVADLEREELKTLPQESAEYLGAGNEIRDLVEFEVRYYERTQVYEAVGAKPGRAPFLFPVAITPAEGTDDDFDKWYREEHLGVLAKVTGFRRSTRYKLTWSTRTSVPTYIALHEFETTSLPMAELVQSGQTEWGKKQLGSVRAMETSVWKLEKEFGEQLMGGF